MNWSEPTNIKRYSLEDAMKGDLIIEKKILQTYLMKSEKPLRIHLWVVNGFNTMINCETFQEKKFDDKVYDRLGGVIPIEGV
jgi:hypothetical protein